MNKYFYCYSYPLKEYFKKNGLNYITDATNHYKGFNFRYANETIQN